MDIWRLVSLYLISMVRVFKQEEMILLPSYRTCSFCRSKVTMHDAHLQFWRPLHSLSRLLNLFSMLFQCGINLWSYLVNLPIAEEIVLLYCSFSLHKIPTRYCCHLRVSSDEPGSEKRRFARATFESAVSSAHRCLGMSGFSMHRNYYAVTP